MEDWVQVEIIGRRIVRMGGEPSDQAIYVELENGTGFRVEATEDGGVRMVFHPGGFTTGA